MVEESSGALRTKLAKLASLQRVVLGVTVLGLVMLGGITIAAITGKMDSIILAYSAAGWLPTSALWILLKLKMEQLEERISRAELLEKFYAISRKYEDRLASAGKTSSKL